ncbi:MAG: GreA/GreB family elongation factor [Blautia sp.]|nr:GreA/GreB family elongation factor [Blautia sp.]
MGERLTKQDVEKIEEEIRYRTLEVRKEAIESLKEAREQGDLSENFEYYAATRYKNQNESRIRYLQNVLKYATVITDTAKEDEVGLNDYVTVYYVEDEEEEKVKLVTSIRSDSLDNRISIESPIGRAIRGHKVGDEVVVKFENGGSFTLIIKAIEKSNAEDESIQTF